ncbi:MAG: winged helix-turn-helix transcriptional regulator [Anaerolineales bacterium]|nr:winged helix-turn-helix transcriptional regulator [Anaerolineales bacterium]
MTTTLSSPLSPPTLQWEWATGYDCFASLHVLHDPDRFGLRGAWAKGVRTRLPAGAREFLERTAEHTLAAFPWVHTLPAPRDMKTVLDTYAALPVKDRLPAMMNLGEVPAPIRDVLFEVADRGQWMPGDRDIILGHWQQSGYNKSSTSELEMMLGLWADSVSFGEQSLDAFKAYANVFFAEEEARITPALEESIARAQALAGKLALPELLEELSEGVQFDQVPPTSKLVMIPSFWLAPLIVLFKLNPAESLFIFGGRPADYALVPGEAVPDALYNALKALADPTRLRILHYLEEKPQTPTELAATLRLRAPTVIHHLNQLRLAGLVYFSYGKGDKRYAARTSRITEMYLQLRRYLGVAEAPKREEISGRPPYVA